MAQIAASSPAHCEWCPQDWDRSPEQQVACPSCHAAAGHPCKRPSEHTTWTVHATRHQAALEQGIINRYVCCGLCWDSGKHSQGPAQRAAILKRLRQQFPGKDTVPWEATYAAVEYVLARAIKMPQSKNRSKKSVPARQPHQPHLFEMEVS